MEKMNRNTERNAGLMLWPTCDILHLQESMEFSKKDRNTYSTLQESETKQMAIQLGKMFDFTQN